MERDSTWACSDRGTKGNGFRVEESRFRLDFRKVFTVKRSQEQVVHRSCACSIHGSAAKARLDGCLWKVLLPMVEGLE